MTTYEVHKPVRVDTQVGKTRVRLDLPAGPWTPTSQAEQQVADQLVTRGHLAPADDTRADDIAVGDPADLEDIPSADAGTTRRPRRKE